MTPKKLGSLSKLRPQKKKVLITGACGGLACELSRMLCDDYELVGIDPRHEKLNAKFLGELHHSHYRSRRVDEIFRKHKFEAFFHLGRIPVTSGLGRSERYSENVLGTKHLLDLTARHEIPTLVVMSTFHVYGAHPHNPLYLNEEDPLRATQRIPELSDAMELDHLSAQFGLTYKGETVILRPSNVIGQKISNVFSKLLRLPWVPVPIGFDPPLQVLNQSDLINAFLCVLKKPQRGIYNLAGPGSIPVSEILEIKKIKRVPVPDFLIKSLLSRLPSGAFNVPTYMVDYFKFPTLIDSTKFSKTYDFEYEHSLIASLENL